MWGVPVVLFFLMTVVLMVASFIVLACLQRETKKFKKRLSKAKYKEDLVEDMGKLDNIMARYVQQFLGNGILEKLADSYENPGEENKAELLRLLYLVKQLLNFVCSERRPSNGFLPR